MAKVLYIGTSSLAISCSQPLGNSKSVTSGSLNRLAHTTSHRGVFIISEGISDQPLWHSILSLSLSLCVCACLCVCVEIFVTTQVASFEDTSYSSKTQGSPAFQPPEIASGMLSYPTYRILMIHKFIRHLFRVPQRCRTFFRC